MTVASQADSSFESPNFASLVRREVTKDFEAVPSCYREYQETVYDPWTEQTMFILVSSKNF